MSNIKIGSRVKCITSVFPRCFNKTGKVVCVRGNNYGVKFDTNVGGHSLDGLIDDGYGRYLTFFELELIEEQEIVLPEFIVAQIEENKKKSTTEQIQAIVEWSNKYKQGVTFNWLNEGDNLIKLTTAIVNNNYKSDLTTVTFDEAYKHLVNGGKVKIYGQQEINSIEYYFKNGLLKFEVSGRKRVSTVRFNDLVSKRFILL